MDVPLDTPPHLGWNSNTGTAVYLTRYFEGLISSTPYHTALLRVIMVDEQTMFVGDAVYNIEYQNYYTSDVS